MKIREKGGRGGHLQAAERALDGGHVVLQRVRHLPLPCHASKCGEEPDLPSQAEVSWGCW